MQMAPQPGLSANGWYQLWREGDGGSSPERFEDQPGWLQEAWETFAEKANRMVEKSHAR